MSRKSNQAAVVSGGRGAHGGNDGGTGAPPSNTAPDNSIQPVFFQPLRWGIDSLYLSYPGTLSEAAERELRRLKLKAQGPDYEAAEAQIQLGSHVFEVRDKSSGKFAFTLADDAYMIRLSASSAKSMPMAYVQVSSRVLSHKGAAEIERELRSLLAELGEVHSPKVSRVDLFLDFASTVDMESWTREAWVTRASAVSQYAEDSAFTGWTIGAGGALMARLYNKLLECKKRGKEYLLGLWAEAGWSTVPPVWRIEFEFRREVLAQLGLDCLEAVLEHRGGLWSYASTEWLKLCEPNPADRTRSRWPIHPLWAAIASVDWETAGGPLLRSYKPIRAPSEHWIGARALALVASIAAIRGLGDFEAAASEVMDLADAALGEYMRFTGVDDAQRFEELTRMLRRKYNTALNVPVEVEAEDDPKLQNPYYRAKQGL